jgi:frataxin-like iron-binding protein CyaY|tara:strand:- start:216 stop:470 length:255 start_codon:yes stop_codon:yes gene_type:complete
MTDKEAIQLHKLIEELRAKLKKSLQETLQLRKDLDLGREELQLSELKYNKLKDAITLEIDDKLNKARAAVEIAADEPVYKKDVK